ncbi:MAG TPA: VWA domain-containing protein, partial [Candidatus Hydrogenedens sp.]|nr:VWA domain-containing protein [Candidatus Hydrogenedens sp.]
ITSINPEQGSLGKDKEQKVKVTISRDTLTYLGDSHKIIIKSNDVNYPESAITIEVQVPRKVIIGATPMALSYGTREILKEFDLANIGDPETVLNFMLIPNKDWISVSPESGISIGTASAIKDWKTISVSIDREGLKGTNSSGQIQIVATKLVNGQNVIDTAVDPVLITITAAAPPLSIETPPPNLRIPSLVRYVMLFRDIQQQSISFPEAFLPTLTSKFLITEDDLPLEISESNRFLVPMLKPEKLVQCKGSILIMLDASGSMLKSVQLMEEQGISDATDPIRELYVRTVMPMIDEIPDNYKIAIGVFNEREWNNNPVRILINNDGEPMFTYNKEVAKNRLLSMNIIDHGATALLPAISDGAVDLFLADGDHIPYDVSDDRIMLIITDGRMTTPPGQVSPVVDVLKGVRARPFFVSWGENVNNNVMVQLIEETGGHVYSTRNQDTGQVDSLGRPISKPLLSALADWLETNPNDPCDRSIAKDIKSQLLFEFIALNQKAGATVRIDVDFDSPADGNTCIPDQGNISTAFAHSQMDLESYANDVRLGQIKLISSGIDFVSQSVDVVVYADYIPRNITALFLSIDTSDGNPAMTMSVSQPTLAEGGLISDWDFVQQGSLLQFTSASNQPLPYGAFGSLCVLHFENASQPFKLQFDVANPQISADQDSKYFTHPNLFDVEVNPSFAPSNPYPYLESEPAMNDNSIIVLPDDVYDLVVDIYNKGGSHRPTNVGLYWDVEVFTGDFFGDIVKPPDEERFVFENETPYKLHIPINREEMKPGNNYLGILQFSFDSIFHNAIVRYVTVYCNIQQPEITVEPTELIFDSPNEIEEKSFVIRNTGQSILSWTLNRGNLPVGYSFSKYAGSLGPYDSPYNLNKEDYITITVDKALIDNFAPIIPILSNGGTVSLQLIVSSP